MKRFELDEMVRGWFVGRFAPVAYDTDGCEVAVKRYAIGDTEDRHVHDVVTEITAVVHGRVRMSEHVLGPGDIIVVEPGEATDFEALTEATLVAVKVPGVAGDKRVVAADPLVSGVRS